MVVIFIFIFYYFVIPMGILFYSIGDKRFIFDFSSWRLIDILILIYFASAFFSLIFSDRLMGGLEKLQ